MCVSMKLYREPIKKLMFLTSRTSLTTKQSLLIENRQTRSETLTFSYFMITELKK